MTFALLPAALAVLGAGQAAAPAPPAGPPLTLAQADALSDSDLARRALGQLADLVVAVHRDPGFRPPLSFARKDLMWATFDLRPRPAFGSDGVCTLRTVTVSFGDAPDAEHWPDLPRRPGSPQPIFDPSEPPRDPDHPVRVDDIKTDLLYRLLPPGAPAEACSGFTDRSGFFFAPDAGVAQLAGIFIDRIREGLVQAEPPFVLDCAPAGEGCDAQTRRLTRDGIVSIERCPDVRPETLPPGGECLAVTFADRQIGFGSATTIRSQITGRATYGDGEVRVSIDRVGLSTWMTIVD